MVKKVLRFLAAFLLIIIFVLLGLIIWLTISDYRPDSIEKAEVTNASDSYFKEEITIINWNLGYGGLGKDMDFFMDGGTRVRAPEGEYEAYWQGIQSYLSGTDAQVYFFQEMDRSSTRSYREDQYKTISSVLGNINRTFAPNYKVKFIPSPRLIGTQYGSVHSGLSIYSQYNIIDSMRYSLPGNYLWPKSVFFLDRCLLVSTIKGADDKNIVLINAHLSAYDKGGFLKKEQLDFLQKLAEDFYHDGNYVVIGGDWNSYMPGTDGTTFPSVEDIPEYYQSFPSDWEMAGWKWGVDPTTPTNRSLAESYSPGKTFTPVIDGFLVSPNVTIKKVRTIDLGFQFSDHNPIEITLSFE